MSSATDPPSVERKSANAKRRARGLGRKLINRRILIVGIQIVYLTVRIVEAVKKMFGDD